MNMAFLNHTIYCV